VIFSKFCIPSAFFFLSITVVVAQGVDSDSRRAPALLGPRPSEQPSAPARPQTTPAIRQGMPYDEARKIILSAGWQASLFKKTILNELDLHLQEWFTKAGFLEIEECAGTGDALCVAEFHDAEGKHKLYVFTTSGSSEEIKYIGHDPQIVSFCVDSKTVNCDKPAAPNLGPASSEGSQSNDTLEKVTAKKKLGDALAQRAKGLAVVPREAATRSPQFELVADGANYPIIRGTTDLPDGTVLLVNLKRPWLPDARDRLAKGLPACEDSCAPAMGSDHHAGALVVVSKGQFLAGPFSFSGKPIPPGWYPVEISLSVDPATATIEQIRRIGTRLFSSQIKITPSSGSARELSARTKPQK
jgi:hypothetical protein